KSCDGWYSSSALCNSVIDITAAYVRYRLYDYRCITSSCFRAGQPFLCYCGFYVKVFYWCISCLLYPTKNDFISVVHPQTGSNITVTRAREKSIGILGYLNLMGT